MKFYFKHAITTGTGDAGSTEGSFLIYEKWQFTWKHCLSHGVVHIISRKAVAQVKISQLPSFVTEVI
jgi:hypothetical protein